MRNLKKVLSLVLALVMTLSLATTAFAATATTTETNALSDVFTDAGEITNVDAVALLNSLGILVGTDGAYNPGDSVTRAQAAKIICYLLLGTAVADTLAGADATTTFTDMAGSEWANGYVQYCASIGIINGYGDGRFGPTDTVTTYQFAKMLLAAVGYGVNGEFTGSAWATNVAVLAIKEGILPKGTINTNCTRDMSALFAYNTLFVDQVTYNNDKSTYDTEDGDGDAIGTLAIANFEYQTVTAELRYDSVKGTYVDKADDNRYTSKDVLVDVTDPTLIGQTVSVDVIGTTAMTDVVADDDTVYTFTDDAYSDYFNDFASSVVVVDNGTATTYPVDGTTATATGMTVGDYYVVTSKTVAGAGQGDIIVATGAAAFTVVVAFATGEIVSLIDSVAKDADGVWVTDGEIDKIIITDKDAAVIGAKGVTTSSSGKITIAGTTISAAASVVYPSDLAKDDVVLYYFNDANDTYYVENAQSVEATVKAVSASKITLNTTQYVISPIALAAFDTTAEYAAYSSQTGTAYVDDNGDLVYLSTTAPAATLDNYLFIGDADSTGILSNTEYYAVATLMDGTTATIQVAKVNGTAVSSIGVAAAGVLGENQFYTFTKTTSGTYLLTIVATQISFNAGAGDDITKGSMNFLSTAAVDTAENYVATSSTAFLVKGATNTTLYTGYKNVPSLTADAGQDAYVLYDGSYTLAVFTDFGNLVDTAYDVVYLTNDEGTDVYDSDGAVDYTYYSVFTGDTSTTLKTADGTVVAEGLQFVNSYDADSYADDLNNVSTVGTFTATGAAPATLTTNGDVLYLDSLYYQLADDVNIYYYTLDDNGDVVCETLTAADINDLTAADMDEVLIEQASPSDDSVVNVYIVDVA